MGLRRSRTSEPSEIRTVDQAVSLPIWQEMLVGIEMVRGASSYRTGTPVAAPVAKFLANDVFQQGVP